ncbi:MAG: glycosyltransferase family 39 protein, partial [Planctomycetota bacterium]
MKSAAWLVLGVALCLRVLGLHFGLDFADVDRTVLNNNVDERGMVETVQRNFLHGNLDPGSFAFRGPGGFLLFGAVDAACVGGLALTRSVGWAEARAALEANPSLVFLCHRLVNVLAGLLTTWLVFRIARREWGLRCGLAAGLLFACAYVPVREAHYGTVDVLWVLPGLWSLEQMLAWQRAPTGRGHGLRVGLALGLAVAIKYHAIFLALPLFVTLWRVGAQGQGGRAPRALRCAVEVGLVAALTLVALSPGVFVAPESFRSIVGFQLETNTAAAGSYDLLGALRFHLRYSLWFGLGEPVLLLAGFGALRAWGRGDAARWFLLCAALLSPLLYATSAHPVRYAMGLLPLFAFLAAQGFERLTARFSARVTGALLALVLAPSLARALTLGWLLPRPDTRVEMLAELRTRALPPAEVLAVGTPHG